MKPELSGRQSLGGVWINEPECIYLESSFCFHNRLLLRINENETGTTGRSVQIELEMMNAFFAMSSQREAQCRQGDIGYTRDDSITTNQKARGSATILV